MDTPCTTPPDSGGDTGRAPGGASCAAWAREQYEARFERSAVPQAGTDLAGRLDRVNDALCRLLGRSREDLLGRHVAQVGHEDDSGEAAVLLAALLGGAGESGSCERVLRDGDGSPLPVRVDAGVVRDAGGGLVGLAGHVTDLRAVRASERARQRQDEMLSAFARLSHDLALVGDAEGTLLHVSPAVRRLFGHEPGDLLAGCGWDLVHPDDPPAAQQAYASVVRDGGSVTMLLRVRTGDGAWRWVEETCRDMRDSSIGGIVCNLVDVTERVEAEEALRRSELRYRTLAETAQEGIWAVSADGRTQYANGRVAAILGVPLEEVYARRAVDLLDARDAAAMSVRLATRRQRGSERYELTYSHPDGQTRHLAVSAAPWLDDADGEGSLALLSDVTEARRAQAELAASALQDRLTGLANRVLLRDRLEQLVLHADRTPVVLFVDLDHFKLVNDSRGHASGDEVLVVVADRLRATAGPQHTVARFGGDSFVVLLADGDEGVGGALAEDLLIAVGAPVELSGGDVVHVSASVGVAARRGADAEDLLRFADTAVYAAKASGRGRVRVFDPPLADEVEQRFALAGDLRAALADDGLDLHYQPVVELATGRVVGVEALARWEHPQRGAVGPERFVAVAEMTGLSPELDRWVLARALSDVGRLRAAGDLPADAYVAVNLSAANLRDSRLDVVARQWAQAAAVPVGQVVLEVTETALMDEPDLAVAVLRRLRDAGFSVALDDFGTGYSSLAYLRELPVSMLKIDRSFVRDITTHPDALAIAASVVDLGRAVGVAVVAEGVETVEQAAELHRLGCRNGQGWLWSRALPAGELAGSGLLRTGFQAAPAAPPRRLRRPTSSRLAPLLPEHGLERLLELHHEQGASLVTVAAALNNEGYRTPGGVRWHRASVARAIAEAAHPALVQGAPGGC